MRGALVAVESRDEIIKRIGRSPDLGTAYVLSTMSTPRMSDFGPSVRDARIAHDPYEALHEARERMGSGRTDRMNYDPYSR